jgi:hypothetical protein
MRPIDQDGSGFAYSGSEALAAEVVYFDAPAGDDGEGPPQAVRSTVAAETEKLEALLALSFDPSGRWEKAEDAAEAGRLAARIGEGYEVAVGELIDRIGPYCAYCGSAEPTGLRADPVKPPALFPREAFDPGNLLLACETCRARKLEYLTRAAGALSSVRGPVQPIWPHTYWKGLPSTARLPLRCRLFEGRGGGAADWRPVSTDRARELVVADRERRVEAAGDGEGGPHLVVRPRPARPGAPAVEPVHLAALIEADDARTADGGAPQDTIDMLDLNCRAGDPDDPRLELRTRAYLTALDYWERTDSIERGPAADEELRAAVDGMLDSAIRATGFWLVWLQVFRDTPGFQQRLAGLLPGTAATPAWEV